jgi:hypothetical protein
MIVSYNSFLLLESIVKYFPNFRDTLRMMKSPIAKELLELQGKDLDVVSNYIGVSGDDSVTFVPDKKSSEVRQLFKIINTNGIIWGDEYLLNIAKKSGIDILNKPVMGDLCYFHMKIDPQLASRNSPSWVNYGTYNISIYKSSDQLRNYMIFDNNIDICLEETSDFFGAKPQSIKVGRFSKKMLELVGKKFSDREIEEFVNEFKSTVELTKDAFRNFELVSGEDIVHWYHESNYSRENQSTLHGSCMRYDDCGEYFGIYTENPQVCQLLIKKNDFNPEKITGRAIVWKLKNGDTFMDRIYYSKDSDINLFKEWARRNGWAYKKNQNSSSGLIMINQDESYTKPIEVKLEKWIFKKYPYLDTISYLGDDGVLRDERRDSDCKELHQTDGSFTQGCEYCDGNGYNTCRECDGEGYSECFRCGGSGSFDCSECDGEGDLECPECDGEGVDSDGKECDNCKGGRVRCPECDGRKETECDNCEGNGNITCEYCEDGRVPCNECN